MTYPLLTNNTSTKCLEYTIGSIINNYTKTNYLPKDCTKHFPQFSRLNEESEILEAAKKIHNFWPLYLNKIKAAQKIQNCWRLYFAKKKLATLKEEHLLNFDYFTKMKPFIDKTTDISKLIQIENGNTEVYTHPEQAVIIKNSGEKESYQRFVGMRLARDLCKKNNYKNLVIPKAKIYKNLLLEDKLPLMNDTMVIKDQIAIYIENKNLFTLTAKEFTEFLFLTNIDDLTLDYHPGNIFTHFFDKTALTRYDNAFFYIEEGQGKMGLIDLHSNSKFMVYEDKLFSNFSGKRSFYYAAKIAVQFFPYHINEIIDTIKKFYPEIIKERKNLENKKDSILKIFKLIYQDHLTFIKKNIINIVDSDKILEISCEQKNFIIDNLLLLSIKEIKKEDLQVIRKKYLTILDIIITIISEKLKNNQKGKIIASDKDLAIYRTIILDTDPKSRLYNLISLEFQELIPMNMLDYLRKKSGVSLEKFSKIQQKEELIKNIFNQLKSQQLIAESVCYKRKILLFC